MNAADAIANEARKFPVLSRAEELKLAKAAKKGNKKAREKLFKSNLRFVLKKANEFKGYANCSNIDFDDLVQQAADGLHTAIDKFDPNKGNKLITYATWWIHARLADYTVRNFGTVRTSGAGRELFWRHQDIKDILDIKDPDEREEARKKIAATCNKANVNTVRRAEFYISGSTLYIDGPSNREDVEGRSFHDLIAAENAEINKLEDTNVRMRIIKNFNTCDLTERERYILCKRYLTDEPVTLQSIADEYGISRERIRQVEAQALKKLRKHFEEQSCTIEDLVA